MLAAARREGDFTVRTIHVCFAYADGASLGDTVVFQRIYAPITPCELDNIRQGIRETVGLPEDTTIIIISWQRYEADE